MGLTMDDFREASKKTVPQCPIARLLDELPPKDRQVLTDALADSSVMHSGIAAVLTKNGHPMRQDPIGRHRRGACACAR